MQDILNERHKECLREMVKLVREDTIEEEFSILYSVSSNKPFIIKKGTGGEGVPPQRIIVDGLSRLGLEALTRAGYIFSIPNYKRKHYKGIEGHRPPRDKEVETSRECYITPQGFRAVDNNFAPVEDMVQHRPPVEITASLAKFKADYPDSTRLAFVMMQFGKSKPHEAILEGIRHGLDKQNFVALRADDKAYHDNLFYNILTYIYGCRFGVAVYERIEDELANVNVSLEVGYMMGINKQVCFLKDRTKKGLQTDLDGYLYREFDPHDCDKTIPGVLWKWMEDKGIMSKRIPRQD